MHENVGVNTTPASREDAIRTGGRTEPKMAPRVPLGEELPLFCEKCGYSLHGMPPMRCDHCTVLQFHCPECGHHQPINTLRPAAQRILGRARATALALSVLLKLSFFGLLLFAWSAMGAEWSYSYPSQTQILNLQRLALQAGNRAVQTPAFSARPIDLEAIIAHVIFALLFGVVGRMLLLRWRRGWALGLILGGLVFLAYLPGPWFTYWERHSYYTIDPPFSSDSILLAVISAATVAAGVMVSWPIWIGLARLLLPKRAVDAMLGWQRSMSDPSSLARE